MNREEALKVIEENRIYYRDWKQEEFNKAIEKLNEPLTLDDFLGWEEEVEYEYYTAQNNEFERRATRAKIVDNIFYIFIPYIGDFLKCPINSEDISNMKQAERVKEEILNVIDTYEEEE